MSKPVISYTDVIPAKAGIRKAVIPAKAGTHFDSGVTLRPRWIPAFAGMTSVVGGGLAYKVSGHGRIGTVNP